MKSILVISGVLSKLILADYNDKYCAEFPLDGDSRNWLTPFNGEYEYNGLENNKPSWKQSSCSYESDCDRERLLHFDYNKWHFEDGEGGPNCQDGKQPDRPEQCTLWWGSNYPDKVLVEACGNEIPDGETPSPSTTTSSSTPIPSTEKYNLIDTTPSCYNKGLCWYGSTGAENSIHPNPEERAQAVLHNIARLYPQAYKNSKYGKYLFSSYGEYEYSNTANCAQRQYVVRKPMYWSSEPNQMARFSQMDHAEHSDTDIGHETSSTYCGLFDGDCSTLGRANKFILNDIPSWSSEGLIGTNMGYDDAHCDPIFDEKITYVGFGFWPKESNSITADYFSDGPEINHPLPSGTHLDERLKLNSNDYNSDGEHLTFLLEFYSSSDSVKEAYVLYDGDAELMELSCGIGSSGFYESHALVPSKCSPYAFFVNTVNGKSYRLPEDERYFFGTATVEYPWSKNEINVPEHGTECYENHYYQNDQGKWIANGSDKFDNTNQACVGCDAIDVLITAYNTKKQYN